MLEKHYISQALFDARQNAFDASAARLKQMQAQAAQAVNQTDYTTLRADADGVMRAMVVSLNDLVREDPESVVLFYELFSLAQRNTEVATELAVLMGRRRDGLAAALAAKRDAGVLVLHAAPDAVAEVLLALGDGVALRLVNAPDEDYAGMLEACTSAMRSLIAPA